MQPFERLQSETRDCQQHLHALPILRDVANGQLQLQNYIRFLTNAYHHVRHTVPLLMACGARLPTRLHGLQAGIREYINEEIGHEQWILDDLAVCGVERNAIVLGEPEFEVEVLVSYVYDYVERTNAVGLFGMVHVLESTSTILATETARAVQATLALPDGAFSYLRSHGELDADHVRFFENLINGLTVSTDVDAVIHVAKRVFRLYGNVLQSAAPGRIDDAA